VQELDQMGRPPPGWEHRVLEAELVADASWNWGLAMRGTTRLKPSERPTRLAMMLVWSLLEQAEEDIGVLRLGVAQDVGLGAVAVQEARVEAFGESSMRALSRSMKTTSWPASSSISAVVRASELVPMNMVLMACCASCRAR
jgi:hypothetical protein